MMDVGIMVDLMEKNIRFLVSLVHSLALADKDNHFGVIAASGDILVRFNDIAGSEDKAALLRNVQNASNRRNIFCRLQTFFEEGGRVIHNGKRRPRNWTKYSSPRNGQDQGSWCLSCWWNDQQSCGNTLSFNYIWSAYRLSVVKPNSQSYYREISNKNSQWEIKTTRGAGNASDPAAIGYLFWIWLVKNSGAIRNQAQSTFGTQFPFRGKAVAFLQMKNGRFLAPGLPARKHRMLIGSLLYFPFF